MRFYFFTDDDVAESETFKSFTVSNKILLFLMKLLHPNLEFLLRTYLFPRFLNLYWISLRYIGKTKQTN